MAFRSTFLCSFESNFLRILYLPFLVLLGLGGLASNGSAQKPIGFERWEQNAPQSSTFFDLTIDEVYRQWANPPSLFVKPWRPKSTRLIDIEFNVEQNGNDVVMSGVWVKNEGKFQLDSWLVTDVTQFELDGFFAKMPGVVILDIERYRDHGETRFAFILQANPNDHDWRVLTGVDQADIEAWESEGYRVLDFDYYSSGPCTPDNEGQACIPDYSYFDAIVVRNQGANYMPTMFTGFRLNQLNDVAGYGWQLTDFEKRSGDQFLGVFVKPIMGYWLNIDQSQNQVALNQLLDGRVADLEGNHYSLGRWITINLPN